MTEEASRPIKTEAKPQRVQLRRLKGWRMPAGTVKVDRSTRWGNPWSVAAARKVGFQGSDAEVAEMCVGMFRNAMLKRLPACQPILADLKLLRGKDLACWCALGAPCHADVLLELANG